MTVRTALVAELFTRCRTGRPGITWFEGFPGDNPPREMVWLSNMTGPIEIPTFNATPLTIQDTATVTLSAESATGGVSRAEAMANVEAYLTDVIRILAAAPNFDGAVEGALTLVPTELRGPYSLPNVVEGGFMATADLDLEFLSRPE